MKEFLKQLAALPDEESLLDFCRRRTLHGTPAVFDGNEDAYYSFRKRIADKFQINFHEVFITGSAKLVLDRKPRFSNENRSLCRYEDFQKSAISSEFVVI